MILVKVTAMLKVDSEKIWKLLKKDKKIQKELEKYIKDEKDRLSNAQNAYHEQQQLIETLQEEYEEESHKIDHIETKIIRQNGEISFIEIKKMMAEAYLKRLNRQLNSATNPKEIEHLQEKILKTEDKIREYKENQNLIQDSIYDLKKEKNHLFYKRRDTKQEIDDNLDILEEYAHTVFIWQEQVNLKEARFYKASFEEATSYFKPCQDLVVPDLEETKKMSTEEAKKEANPIILDEEYILSNPEQIKARKLTKDELDETSRKSS